MSLRVVSPLDAPAPAQKGASAVAGAGAILAHGVLVLLAVAGAGVAREVSASVGVTEMVNVDLPPPLEAPKPPELQPPEPPVRPTPQSKSRPTETPKAAAAASPALTADEGAASGDSIVTGTGPGYAGGVTDSAGTSSFVVRDVGARGAGSPAPAVAPPRADRSRAPQLAGGMRWDCPFPQEADIEGIDRAVVSLRVDLSATGEVRAAQATTDPGFGFARVARRCAVSKRWAPALDRDGNPIAATTVVTVRFDR